MAVINYAEVQQRKLREESFAKLKERLKKEDPLALDQIVMHEIKIKELEYKVRDYKNFFLALKAFLPKDSSMYDTIK
jgi:hypothetical protein